MEGYIDELEDFVLTLISFIGTLIDKQPEGESKGKDVYMAEFHIKHLKAIIRKKKLIEKSFENQKQIQQNTGQQHQKPQEVKYIQETILDIILPDSDSKDSIEQIENNNDIFIPPQKNEKENNNDIFIPQNEPKNQKGGADINIQKDLDSIREIESLTKYLNENNNKEKQKKVTFKEENYGSKRSAAQTKLENKLKSMWRDQVIDIGKAVGIKPERKKKTMNKTYVIKEIMNNPKIHNKVWKQINITESESEN